MEGRVSATFGRLVTLGIVGLVLTLCGDERVRALEGPASMEKPARPAPPSVRVAPDRSLLTQYCTACHNQRLKIAGLLLDIADVERVGERPELWEKVVRRLRSGTMPPAGRPRPDKASSDALVSILEAELDRTAEASPNPGPVMIRRLNRVEYANAIRDLLALEFDPRVLLPPDTPAYGFDNVADALSVSPGLLERYMSAATGISRLALGDPAMKGAISTYKVPRALVQIDRVSEDLPLGSRGGAAVRHHFPLDGDYALRIQLRRNAAGRIRGLADESRLDVGLDGKRIGQFTIGGRTSLSGDQLNAYLRTADASLEVRFAATSGPHLVGVSFVKQSDAVPEGLMPTDLPIGTFSYQESLVGAAAVDSVQISGPFNPSVSEKTESRRRVFICRPSDQQTEASCARRIMSRLARLAFRRAVTDADVRPLLAAYEIGRKGTSFERGIQAALERLLVDPEFLFRIERPPVNVGTRGVTRISDFDLASRLSFFLWSSIPDSELLDAARRRTLADPSVLNHQVRRMLADPRATSLVKNFAGQWLQVRNLQAAAPDPNVFPDFDDNLREAFERETYLFVENEFREDRSVSNLLTADYTFVNERLARHYGIPGVYGNHFRRVAVLDGVRGGLLGHGSLLTVTSYPNRTSPVLRGKFLLGNILGFPPPPPPPNVSNLPEPDAGHPRSVRERLEQHRRNPACAGCHAPMDPLGFALENFDGIGQWRQVDGGAPVDSSGVLPDGTTFRGPTELRHLLEARRLQFVASFAEKLLTYALGRGLDYYDQPAIRKILHEAASQDYRWSSLVLGIVRSTPFQMRRAS